MQPGTVEPTLDIIIVNWNAGPLLRDCVNSIGSASREGFELGRVVVVDNASTDGSAEGLSSTTLPLTIVRNDNNRGFAAACNQGTQCSRADYFLFLNPDTKLFARSLSHPIAFMEREENQAVGICGIQLVDDRGEVSRSCARFPTAKMFYAKMFGLDMLAPRLFGGHFMEEWDHKDTRKVEQVIGAFFLVRRRLFQQLDGFDERFFVYFEEVDFSLRAKKSGWSSYYLADAQAYHKGGGTSEKIKARRLFYSLRSRILYGYKHFGTAVGTGLLVVTLLVEPLSRLGYGILKRSPASLGQVLRGYAMLYHDLPNIFAALRH